MRKKILSRIYVYSSIIFTLVALFTVLWAGSQRISEIISVASYIKSIQQRIEDEQKRLNERTLTLSQEIILIQSLITREKAPPEDKIPIELSKLQNDIEVIKNQLNELTGMSAITTTHNELSKLKENVNSVSNEVSKIKDIIIKKPEDALSLVLLKKDIESLQDRTQNNFNLMTIILVALIGAIISIILRETLKKPETEYKIVSKEKEEKIDEPTGSQRP